MTEDNREEIQEFISSCSKEMNQEEKQLLAKKQYQITLKDTITHITNVIYQQATSEQLKEYKNIDVRVQEVMATIENIIRDIMQAERKLDQIQDLLKETMNAGRDPNYAQIALLQNLLTEYNTKKENIEKEIQNNKTSFVLKELNFISDRIVTNKQNSRMQTVEVAINAPKQEDIINTIKQTMQDNRQKEEIAIEQTKTITQEQKEEETNTLIISERTGKVYLPYTSEDINRYMQKGYHSKDEIVRRKFTVPLKKYTNYAISRVTEGFKLMRQREKAGFGESLKYALNLIFERKLHPAIITACRSQDDLDIYLACLEDGVLSLFDCFKIKFDYAPMKVRQDNRLQYFEGV